jgi:hypothetical protein
MKLGSQIRASKGRQHPRTDRFKTRVCRRSSRSAAGLELVTRLGDRLGRRSRSRVTLVERARTHLWKPMLHEVAAGSMDPSEYEVNYLAQAHWHRFRYR